MTLAQNSCSTYTFKYKNIAKCCCAMIIQYITKFHSTPYMCDGAIFEWYSLSKALLVNIMYHLHK